MTHPPGAAATSLLLAPLTIGRARTTNRIAVAPMTNKQADADGRVSLAEIDWIGQRADGGFGLVITGAWAVAREGLTWDGQAGLYDERHEAPLADLGRRIAATSALGIVQLIHGGSRATRAITLGEGVSATAGSGWTAASEADIEQLLEAHRIAALRVRDAGLDGVEIHGAHGFLPAQFLSRTQNTRTDRWGGDLAGRSRFIRELVRSIRAATGNDFVVGVRLTPENRRHGIVLEDTAAIAALLAEDGADYIHLSLGDALAPAGRTALEVVRAAVPPAVRLVAAGGISTVQDALTVLTQGADLVALGTAAILDPAWPRLAADPAAEPVAAPRSPAQLRRVGVTAPFLDYLREGWPQLVSTDETG